jgi:uncharacterized repeat protein (TIGR03803 family)
VHYRGGGVHVMGSDVEVTGDSERPTAPVFDVLVSQAKWVNGRCAMGTYGRTVFRALFGSVMMLCPVAHAATESVLYAFKGGPDAANPVGGLAVIGHTIYGASVSGGRAAVGSIFAVTISGEESVVHSFSRGGGGLNPLAGVVAVAGVLYGTDTGPNHSGHGQLIRVSRSGRVLVEHRFAGPPSDGSLPAAPLLYRHGKFYGTTEFGGEAGYGAVFSVTSTGRERVLLSFNGVTDAGEPLSSLVLDEGQLYGTTSLDKGTVFSLNRSGEEKVLHQFTGSPDGATPRAGLLDVGGRLYGTTTAGGNYGYGTVFSITKAGQIKILYSFQGGRDGAFPTGNLINVGGTFYGTTTAGGGASCTINGIRGCGTVFSITPDGTETVLHHFHFGADGADPQGPLVSIGGNLYGVTYAGGEGGNFANGDGTVFVITP